MSQYGYDDDEYQDDSDGIKSLRSALKKAQKELEETQKQLKEVSLEKRSTTLASTLESFGVNPKIAAFIPADVDASTDAVRGWLNEYGDVFGVTPDQPEQPKAGFYTDEEKAEIGRINKVDQTATTPGSPQSMADQIAGAQSEAELLAILRQAQG